MNKFYAVIQHNHACFGVGVSREAAIVDASEWLDCESPLLETQLVEWYNAVSGDLVLCECTEEYYSAVLEDGSVLWCMDNGVIKLEGG